MHSHSSVLCGLAVGLVALFGVSSGVAQEPLLQSQEGEILLKPEERPVFEVAPLDPSFATKKQAAEKRRLEQEGTLRELNDALVVSNTKRKELQDSVTALVEDRTALVEKLISTARDIQRMEDSVFESKRRLEQLSQDEKAIKRSLVARRAVLAEVLGALQRMGKNPPPAIVVSPDDTLSAVRSAILLGSVLPELRAEAEALVADLTSLAEIIDNTTKEWAIRVEQERVLSEEQVRLDLLIKENQRLKANSDLKLAAETNNNQSLIEKATNLRDLITSISSEISTIDKAASSAQTAAQRDAAKKAAAFEAARLQALADINNLKPADERQLETSKITPSQPAEPGVVLAYNSDDAEDPAVLPDTEREIVDYGALVEGDGEAKPSFSFSKSKGKLALPVRGVLLRSFGEADGLGGQAQGMTYETRAQAPVVSPTSGRVVFAGAFSGFDQLLIIDVGDGYHMVLAGMSRIDVKVGDAVAAGEPVASMGGKRSVRLAGVSTDAAALLVSDFSSGQTQPVLYVELRRNGRSINSSPWWVKT